VYTRVYVVLQMNRGLIHIDGHNSDLGLCWCMLTAMTSRGLPPSGRPVDRRSLAHLDPRVEIPSYDRGAVSGSIVHIGVGGFHRAHLATYVDELCASGRTEWGIIGSGVLPKDRTMAEVLHRQDGLYTLIVRGAQTTTVRVVGSILKYIHGAPDPEPLIEQLANASTRMVSLTVTEGGYPVDEVTGGFDPSKAPAGRNSAFGVIGEALVRRRNEGIGPFTVVSCDNVVSNGNVARAATLGVAEEHDPQLRNWIEGTVPFPNSMVDRITPATTDADRDWLAAEYQISDGWPVVTEPFRQWVIEDEFVGDRAPWEEVGAIVTPDVERYELMKLRLLNAGHSCVAYLAGVAGVEYVHDAMADPLFERFLRRFLQDEAGPALPDVPGMDIPSYQASLIERFSNPAIRDQISRLCLDGSAKFPKFLMPTVRAQLSRQGPVELSAMAIAGWCAYLIGIADDGKPITHAHDPDLETVREYALRSVDNPSNFIGYRPVFGEDLPRQARFVEAFERAITSIRSSGVRPTLDAFLSPRGS